MGRLPLSQATMVGLGLGVAYAPPPRVHQLVGGHVLDLPKHRPAHAPHFQGWRREYKGVGREVKRFFVERPSSTPPAELHPTSKKQDFLLKLFALFSEF